MSSTLRLAGLLALLTVLMVVLGNLLGGQSGMMVAFAFAMIMNFGSYWFSDTIVLKMHRAQEVTAQSHPGLFRIMDRLVKRAKLPMPKVYIIPDRTPNAFATGRNPNHSAVAFSQGILDILNEDEISGVAAHELAHIKNRDILISTIAATMAGAISMLANMAQWAFIFGGRDRDNQNPFAMLIGMILAPIAAMLVQMAISRSREYVADRVGAEIHGRPIDLASALDKLHSSQLDRPLIGAKQATAHMYIVAPFSGRKALNLFSTHPPVEERIKRLQAMK